MITDEERREIIEQAKQEFMLIIPEVMGNLMTNHAALAKMNMEFYKAHPELKDHKDVVVAVLEQVDGEDTLDSYENKLEKALPIIKERIRLMDSMDMQGVSRTPNRNFSDFQGGGSNGEL